MHVEEAEPVATYHGASNAKLYLDGTWAHVHTDQKWMREPSRFSSGWYFLCFEYVELLRMWADCVGSRDIIVWPDVEIEQQVSRPSAAVYARFDGTIIIEIRDHRFGRSDWVHVSADIENAVGRVSERVEWAQVYERMCASCPANTPLVSRFCISMFNREEDLQVKICKVIDAYVLNRELEAWRQRRARRILADALERNLSAIKERLWRPHGRLVARMMAEI